MTESSRKSITYCRTGVRGFWCGWRDPIPCGRSWKRSCGNTIYPSNTFTWRPSKAATTAVHCPLPGLTDIGNLSNQRLSVGLPVAPSTDWKMNITGWKDERADLVHSTHSAAKYLAWLNRVKKINLNGQPQRDGFNDWLLTTAAYNAGPTRIVERLNAFGASSYWDVPLPAETEKYVPRWIALWLISKNRDFYGVKISPSGTVAFDTIEKIRLQKDLSFAAIATLLGTTPRAIWSLNTEIAPEKGVFPAKSGRRAIEHRINVPRGSRGKLLAQLAAHGYTKK